jgi:hypothetical protein
MVGRLPLRMRRPLPLIAVVVAVALAG